MAKITHVTRLLGDLSQLDEIPSEILEPCLVTHISMVIESVGFGWTTPAQARAELKGVEHFISIFGGIHSRIATSNRVYQFCNMTDESMIEICKKVCEEADIEI